MAGRINADRTVEGNAESLAGLVNSKFKLHIPVFQRGYSWLTSDVTRFINDLWQAYSNRHAWFLGSLVTQSKDKDSLELYIIDGQQRLTTINLLMIALREISQLSNDNEQVGFFNDKLLKKTVSVSSGCHHSHPNDACCNSRVCCRTLTDQNAKTHSPFWSLDPSQQICSRNWLRKAMCMTTSLVYRRGTSSRGTSTA